VAFFDSPQAAAVFKHAVLEQYLRPFAMKTGLWSVGHRVAFVDGYAGPGLYEDGANGSPALTIEVAREIAGNRTLECHFVEQHNDYYVKLTKLIDERAAGLSVRTYHGDVSDYFNSLIENTRHVPTFMFLDPFGLVVPFDSISKIFDRPAGPGQPAVEVLINFTAVGLRRIAGLLADPDSHRTALEHMDSVCGGQWWRTAWTDNRDNRVAAEKTVVTGYANRLSQVAGSGWWISEVRNKSHHLPVYYLVFLTRHRDGHVLFGNSLSLALGKWRKFVHDKEALGTLLEETFNDSEEALESGWVDEIEKNLRRLLAEGNGFLIYDRYGEVFGSTVGQAREKHLRKAWKRLYASGETPTASTGDLVKKRIYPA
jgi:three-Cys-motif partner protein